MVLKLDPRFPLVWRSPDSLQLGVDAPVVVLERVSSVQERLVAALVSGVGRSGLDMIANSGPAAVCDVDELLSAVKPALLRATSPGDAIAVEGHGITADRIRSLIDPSGSALAVIVAHHVIEPEQHGRWLRRDVPHLPIVYGDAVVRIGPIVEPGTGPCLYCLDLHRTDADRAWPAIATQLWGRVARTETPLVAGEVAAIATRMVLARLAVARPGPATSIELDASTGTRTSRRWERHPDCLCTVEYGAGEISEARPETGKASARHHDPNRSSPRRGADAAAPA
jgi:bacteriocin biosynthesis cyclodehydratase domain-containing protein